jgi:hypothetical protein
VRAPVQALPSERGAEHDRDGHRGQVTDRRHLELSQPGEDLPGDHQQGEAHRRGDLGGAGAEHQGQHNRRDDDVRRPDVQDGCGAGGQAPVIDAVGDDTFADEGADDVPGSADRSQPQVAERPGGAEHRQRNEHQPGQRRSRRQERRHHQRGDRVIVEVDDVGAGPLPELAGLPGRQQCHDDAGRHDAGQESACDRVPGEIGTSPGDPHEAHGN